MTKTEKYLNDCFDFNSIRIDIEAKIDLSLPTQASYLKFFIDYVEFNYVFAGCVSSLAGRFHTSPSVEKCPVLDKVSHFVAKNVFEAAIDEYQGITHKEMSLCMIRDMKEFFDDGYDLKPSKNLSVVLRNVREGYGQTNECRFDELALNLGFHIASEKLASFEFSYLDTKIKEDYPEFYTYLNGNKAGQKFKSWLWVEIHGEVEEEHANFAFTASDLIFNELEDEEKVDFLKKVQYGFNTFVEVQSEFFDAVSLQKEFEKGDLSILKLD